MLRTVGVNAVLALGMAAAYGWPLLAWFARTGWRLPETTDAYEANLHLNYWGPTGVNRDTAVRVRKLEKVEY